MQDNARFCIFFEDHGITTLDWPAQSPDYNLIENLWSIIKQRRAKKFEELIEQVFEIWDNIDAVLKKKLAERCPNV